MLESCLVDKENNLQYNTVLQNTELHMTATVRLDEALESKLEHLSKTLHKKKSDVIREAINYYSMIVDKKKKSRILAAVEKTKHADKEEYSAFEGTLNDGL